MTKPQRNELLYLFYLTHANRTDEIVNNTCVISRRGKYAYTCRALELDYHVELKNFLDRSFGRLNKQ